MNAAVLWDMDGVLVDTGELHYQSWVGTLHEYGLHFSRETFRRTFGMNNRALVNLVFNQIPSEEFLAKISDTKESLFRRSAHGNVQPLPGVVDWILQLQAWGFQQAVASSAPMENVTVLMAEIKLDQLISTLVSGSDIPGKPDPAVFLKAAQILGVPPDRCVVIEDSIAGLQAANAAGMACIAVLTTNPAELLQTADIIAQDLTAIPVTTVKQLLNIQ